MVAAVSLEQVTYRYPGGTAGVFDLSLTIEPGELVVCIGPSGCGKTTLLKLIAGFLRPDQGMVRLQGDEVTHVPVRERGCGIVFQSYALFPHMRVWENVAYPLRVRNVAMGERRAEASRLLELVGLAELGERLPAQLSGGQQQRVALARALACSPRVLLLDEPLSALDAATRVAMRDEIRRIQRSQNIAALLITHDQDEALSLADRIAVLREGRLIQFAAPQETYDRPASAFVAGFVGRANLVEARAVAADAVDTAFGRFVTPPHGLGIGESVRLLIRPERIEPLSVRSPAIDNVLSVRILHDRFYGASRQVDVVPEASEASNIHLQLETTSRDPIHFVHVPREAIQFVNA
jgi:putative spermidine/putrescine transport system ATP-binding protein